MISEKNFYGMLGSIYDAALDPSGWSEVFCRLEQAFGVDKVLMGLTSCKPGKSSLDLNLSLNFDPAFLRSYNDYYHQYNYSLHDSIQKKQLLAGGIFNVDYNIEPNKPEHREFCADWVIPQDAPYVFGACLTMNDDTMGLLSLVRGGKAGAPINGHFELLRRLTPHLQRAVSQHLVFGSRVACLEDALSRIPLGVIVFNVLGVPVFINKEAGRIIAEKDGLSLSHAGRIKVENSSLEARISAVLKSASTTWERRSAVSGGVVQVLRPSGKRPYSLMISPASGRVFEALDGVSRALILINDPVREPPESLERLCMLYRLTRAEAELVELLASGLNLDEISQILSVTRNTARTLLQRAFQKTGTRRQAQLVSLVSRDGVILSN